MPSRVHSEAGRSRPCSVPRRSAWAGTLEGVRSIGSALHLEGRLVGSDRMVASPLRSQIRLQAGSGLVRENLLQWTAADDIVEVSFRGIIYGERRSGRFVDIEFRTKREYRGRNQHQTCEVFDDHSTVEQPGYKVLGAAEKKATQSRVATRERRRRSGRGDAGVTKERHTARLVYLVHDHCVGS